MKIRRYKYARKVLSFYKNTFGLREPYQILVDGTFCQAALKGKIQLREQLTKYLGGEVQLVTTACILSELSSLGDKLKGAYYIAKRLQERRCPHASRKRGTASLVTAAECIQSMIGEHNEKHYCVASQDSRLQKDLRKLPGVPLLHIIRNTIVLEGLSEETQTKAEEINSAKLGPTPYQQTVIDQLNKSTVETKNKEQSTVETKKMRRKRPRGPNPLSVKKSSKVSVQVRQKGVVTKSKKRRQRLERRKAIQSLAAALQLSTASTSQ